MKVSESKDWGWSSPEDCPGSAASSVFHAGVLSMLLRLCIFAVVGWGTIRRMEEGSSLVDFQVVHR